MEPDSRPCSSARTHLASIEFLRVRHQWVKLANCDKRLITGARSSYSAVWNMLSIRTPAPLTESQWAAVRATLPTGTDEAWFRSELNRIASDTVPPNKRQWIHLKRAQACGDLIRELPYLEHIKDKDALAEQLKRHQQEENNRANELGASRRKNSRNSCSTSFCWICGSAPAASWESQRHIKNAAIATAHYRPAP
jgi:hypothetical protein